MLIYHKSTAEKQQLFLNESEYCTKKEENNRTADYPKKRPKTIIKKKTPQQ